MRISEAYREAVPPRSTREMVVQMLASLGIALGLSTFSADEDIPENKAQPIVEETGAKVKSVIR